MKLIRRLKPVETTKEFTSGDFIQPQAKGPLELATSLFLKKLPVDLF